MPQDIFKKHTHPLTVRGFTVYFFSCSVTMKMPRWCQVMCSFHFCFLPQIPPLPKQPWQRPFWVSTLDHCEKDVDVAGLLQWLNSGLDSPECGLCAVSRRHLTLAQTIWLCKSGVGPEDLHYNRTPGLLCITREKIYEVKSAFLQDPDSSTDSPFHLLIHLFEYVSGTTMWIDMF